ncbi:MAG TPA: type II toxin-antitoxin system prevent-host-death family antitoxin [bacterium]|nr:type II toxin-antitoxin system prevent-host-death family antitoxin [bacterium]
MKKVNARDARAGLPGLLNRVAKGEEIVIQRRGKVAARLLPPGRPRMPLPDLTAFRASIRVKGGPLSATVIKGRREERF